MWLPIYETAASGASSNSASTNSAGDERPQGVGRFAQADELDRDLELVDDRDQHAALGRRVEFGDDDAA